MLDLQLKIFAMYKLSIDIKITDEVIPFQANMVL